MGKCRVPYEMMDLAWYVWSNVKSLDELWYNIRVIRTRPYSRIAAIIIKAPEGRTLREYCLGLGEDEVVDYVVGLGVCSPSGVYVYRGGSDIRAGDWVALDRGYAEYYGPVSTKFVSLDDVVWSGVCREEWYYVPKELVGVFRSVEDFWYSVRECFTTR